MFDFKIIPPSEVNIVKRINKGGFAEVSLATYQDQQVAVKVFMIDRFNPICNNDDLLKERHKEEVEILSALPKDPHLIAFIGAMEKAIIMEFVDGFNLEIRMKQNCSYQLRMDFAEQAAACVAVLSRLKIVHCDLKTENFLVNKENRLKLADFGLAKQLREETWVHNKYGCVLTKSPENLLYQQASLESDAFSLGVILWELHTLDNVWPGCFDASDVIRNLKNKNRPLFDSQFLTVNHSCALIAFGLWRESCDHRTQAHVAEQQLHAMNERLKTNTKQNTMIAEINAYFDKSPKQYWLDGCEDQNKEIMTQLFNDTDFQNEWLLERVEQKDHIHTSPLFKSIDNLSFMLALVSKSLSKELLLLNDESHNCTLLVYFLRKLQVGIIAAILKHQNLTDEIFELFFSSDTYHCLWTPYLSALPNPLGYHNFEDMKLVKIVNLLAVNTFFKKEHFEFIQQRMTFFKTEPSNKMNPAAAELIERARFTIACQK